MRVTHRRDINRQEMAVIRTALERAPKYDKCCDLIDQIESLQVVGGCDCGCASVDFQLHGQSPPAQPIADATGTTQAGGTVGVLIWGSAERITGLEIYDLGAGDDDLQLPTIESIGSWDGKS